MNRGYTFGMVSIRHIKTTSDDMKKLCHKAMQIANTRKTHCPDWGVTSGKRTTQEQFSLYLKGRIKEQLSFKWVVIDKSKVVTNCDGTIHKSIHQFGDAVDIYVVGKDRYDPAQLALVATCFFEAADDLGLRIDWGGSFRSISDACHVEIVRNR